jgi:putative tricarboxylic transport membrane protein
LGFIQFSLTPKLPRQTMQRRALLSHITHTSLGLAALSALSGQALLAQSAQKPKLANKLRIVIPAGNFGPLNEFGRSVGDSLVGMGLCDEVDYDNREGKGGATGLAYFIEKHGTDANALLVADSSLVGALPLHKAGVDLRRVTPIARLTSDALVVVVAANSPIKTIAQLVERMRTAPKQTPIGITQMGGVEHVFAGLLGKSATSKPEDAVYLPIARGFEMNDALLAGKMAAAISGYRTFAADLASGKLRALAVSSKRAAHGIASVREQGQDVDINNWRAVFTGQALTAGRQADMVDAMKTAVTYELWKKTLKQNYWDSAWLSGADLGSFIDIESKTTTLMVQLLKLSP